MSSGHDLSQIAVMSQATPLFLIAMCMVVITVLRVFFYETITKWGYSISSNVIEVDENLPNFFKAVKLSDADWLVKENNYYDEKYGIRFTGKSAIDKLDDWKVAKNPISGIAWYNVLANPVYMRDFNYIQVDVPQREDLIVDGDDNEGNDCEQSDMVTILLNLGYVNEDVARNFRFAPGYSSDFKAALKKQKGN